MEVREFGEGLIRTGDLDPVYVAIWGAQMSPAQSAKLLLSYWCFYHLGLSAWMSDQGDNAYWEHMVEAARNETESPVGGRWPRSAERRHFRGEKCVRAVETLSHRAPLSWIAEVGRKRDELGVMEEVMKWPLFGPWISFKVADMLERCMGIPIIFSPGTITMYQEPRKALDMLDEQDPIGVYYRLLDHFARFDAPPSMDRKCGPQEVETVLCKWKSHAGGHYWVGKDIHEVSVGLEGWGPTADRLSRAMPPAVVNGHHA